MQAASEYDLKIKEERVAREAQATMMNTGKSGCATIKSSIAKNVNEVDYFIDNSIRFGYFNTCKDRYGVTLFTYDDVYARVDKKFCEKKA